MANDTNVPDLTRRKLLGGLGAVGVASVGAGLGTSAYFSDTEAFTNNSLTAGTLDLKLDYKATYLGGEGRLDAVTAMGYPDAESLGDGRYLLDQAPSLEDEQEWEDMVQGEEFNFCSPEADEFLVNGDGIPVFTLQDIKPGDSGEVTISIHLCTNPAFLQLVGEITENGENDQNDPEIEDEGADTDGVGELADAIEVTVWYDEDCDNVYEPTGTGQDQELEVALVSDVSGSMSQEIGDLQFAAKNFVDNLSNPDEAAAISFSSSASLDQELTTNYAAVKNAIDQYSSGGTTNMTAGISTAQSELMSGTIATAGASKVMILLSDGSPNDSSGATSAATAAKDAGIRIFTIALGSGAATSFLENNIASSPDDAFIAPNPADLDTVYSQIAQVVLSGEQPVFEGSMADLFDELSEGVLLDGNRQEEGVQPYPGQTTQCIGFEWELPFEVGNEVQSDSIGFDVGVEAEQSRNNDSPFAEAQ